MTCLRIQICTNSGSNVTSMDHVLNWTIALDIGRQQWSSLWWQNVEAFICSEQWREFSSAQDMLLVVVCFLMVYMCLILRFTSTSAFAKTVLFSWGSSIYKCETQLPRETIIDLIIYIVPSSLWKSLVRRKMVCCYKLDRQSFPILDHLLHMVHFRKLRRNSSL